MNMTYKENFKTFRKANRENILKMSIPKLFIGLVYFNQNFNEGWGNLK